MFNLESLVLLGFTISSNSTTDTTKVYLAKTVNERYVQ